MIEFCNIPSFEHLKFLDNHQRWLPLKKCALVSKYWPPEKLLLTFFISLNSSFLNVLEGPFFVCCWNFENSCIRILEFPKSYHPHWIQNPHVQSNIWNVGILRILRVAMVITEEFLRFSILSWKSIENH